MRDHDTAVGTARVVSYPPPHFFYPSGIQGSVTHISRVAFAVVAVLHSDEKRLLISTRSFEPTIRGGGGQERTHAREGRGGVLRLCMGVVG